MNRSLLQARVLQVGQASTIDMVRFQLEDRSNALEVVIFTDETDHAYLVSHTSALIQRSSALGKEFTLNFINLPGLEGLSVAVISEDRIEVDRKLIRLHILGQIYLH